MNVQRQQLKQNYKLFILFSFVCVFVLSQFLFRAFRSKYILLLLFSHGESPNDVVFGYRSGGCVLAQQAHKFAGWWLPNVGLMVCSLTIVIIKRRILQLLQLFAGTIRPCFDDAATFEPWTITFDLWAQRGSHQKCSPFASNCVCVVECTIL